MANLQEETEIKERINVFQEGEGLLVNTSNMLGNKSCFIDL